MKILIIEDRESDSELLKTYIERIDDSCQIEVETTLTHGINNLIENFFDVLFLDLILPDSDGKDTINTVINKVDSFKNKTVKIIVLTGLRDYKIAKNSLNNGITDFIIKDNQNEQTVKRAITFATYEQNAPKRGMLSFLGLK